MTMDISMSLDGYVAGPNPSLEKPLGGAGVRLFDGETPSALQIDRVGAAPTVTHLRYRTGGK